MTSGWREDAPCVKQFPSPSLTLSRSSSICSTDEDSEDHFDLTNLDKILDQPQPDVDAVVQPVNELLEDSQIEPAFPQGWFRPGNKYSSRLEEKLIGLKLDEAADAFFYRDMSRKLYADHVILPRKQEIDPISILEARNLEERSDSRSTEKQERMKGDQKDRQSQEAERRNRHQRQEEDRRNRHRNCQHDSHERCPEIAAKCGAEHAKKDKLTRTQEGKGPGKDEQLFSSIYTQEMAARLVQALSERLKRDQHVVRLLLGLLQRQRHTSLNTSGVHPAQHEMSKRPQSSRPGYVGMKRGMEDVHDNEQRMRTRIRHDSDALDSRLSSTTECNGQWR